jgi:hypothetical protein
VNHSLTNSSVFWRQGTESEKTLSSVVDKGCFSQSISSWKETSNYEPPSKGDMLFRHSSSCVKHCSARTCKALEILLTLNFFFLNIPTSFALKKKQNKTKFKKTKINQ